MDMGTVRLVIQIVMLVISLLLITVILMQSSKSSGMGMAFGSDTQSLSGIKGKAASKEAKLQKITKILAVIIGVLAISLMLVR